MENNTPSSVSNTPQSPVPSLVKSFTAPRKMGGLVLPIIVALAVIGVGVGSGWFLSGNKVKGTSTVAPGAKDTAKEAGIADEKTFTDSAEGQLESGGIDGEGTHHLVREGGPSQNVYLTSTVIDLGSFEGKKVKVWGQTISARKAGWLMDVGKVKVID